MTTTQSQYNIVQQLTSVRFSATANLSGVYINGPLNNGVGATLTAASPAALTVDGGSPVIGDRILLSEQTNDNENGIYVVLSSGSASSVWQLQRSADQQSIEQFIAGQFFSVDAGSTLAGAMYVVVEPLPSHLGIDDLSYSPVAVPSGSVYLLASNDLSDVDDVATARDNLGLGSTDDVTFDQVTATNVVTSGINTQSSANALTAFAGGGQGSALQLAKAINRVTTVGTAGDSVKLPAALAGQSVTVINAAAANAMDCFPATGEIINALSANTALSIAANKTVIFSCAVNGTWNSVVTA